jgi:hypothetical protein
MARIGRARQELDRAYQHREAIERLLSDPWARRYLPESFLDFADSQLRKDPFYRYSKDERRVVAEVLEEMKPLGHFAGTSVPDLISMARLCRADCGDVETEQFIDQLVADRPTELPLRQLKHLVGICRLRMSLPPFDSEFVVAADPGEEEEKLERAEAAVEKWPTSRARKSA